jgi:TetR/AcrR family transcriptional repressor of nem operon
MHTKDKIVLIGDRLVRTRGINAFSFSDISKELGIKNSSVHYYFPTKTSLVLAILEKHARLLDKFKARVADMDPGRKISSFLAVYSRARIGGRISILGALSSDVLTFEEEVKQALRLLTEETLAWLSETLVQEQGFGACTDGRSRAVEMISQILGSEQLARININLTHA